MIYGQFERVITGGSCDYRDSNVKRFKICVNFIWLILESCIFCFLVVFGRTFTFDSERSSL